MLECVTPFGEWNVSALEEQPEIAEREGNTCVDEGQVMMSEERHLAATKFEKELAITRLLMVLRQDRVRPSYVEFLADAVEKHYPPALPQSPQPRHQ